MQTKHSGKTEQYQESSQEIKEDSRVAKNLSKKRKNSRISWKTERSHDSHSQNNLPQKTRTTAVQEGHLKSMEIYNWFISIEKCGSDSCG